MKSSCGLLNMNTKDCRTVQQLNITLERELPVFDGQSSVTYRSIGCARCNTAGKLSYWGLGASCMDPSQLRQRSFTALKTVLKTNDQCAWKYVPLSSTKQIYKSCVVKDSKCESNKLSAMSVVKELCLSYSMVFAIEVSCNLTLLYRNPHCALCNPDGKQDAFYINSGRGPPLSILFDVSSNVYSKLEQPHTTQAPTVGSNLTSQILNCSLATQNCTVTLRGKTCLLLTTVMNQSALMDLNTSRIKVLTPQQISLDKNVLKPENDSIFILCPEQEDKKKEQHPYPVAIIYITITGTALSIISLCLLLAVYLSFKELQNLPGKCLISLSWAMMCYQIIFLCSEKSKDVDAVCKAFAICLHFFVLAAFSWMSVMAFDTASTFKRQG